MAWPLCLWVLVPESGVMGPCRSTAEHKQRGSRLGHHAGLRVYAWWLQHAWRACCGLQEGKLAWCALLRLQPCCCVCSHTAASLMRLTVAQVLPCTEPDSDCTRGGRDGQPGGPLDAEKADMVAGMVQLIAATAGADRLRSRGTGESGGSSSRGPRAGNGGDHGTCADGRSDSAEGGDGEGGFGWQGNRRDAVPDRMCAIIEKSPEAASFDVLEWQAAGKRFVQVADAEAAAAYGSRWRCQGAATATADGDGSRAMTATVSAVAAALQRLVRATLQQTAVPAAWVLQAARLLFSQAVGRAPAPLRAAAVTMASRVQAALHRRDALANAASDEWWKHDPHRRASLLTLHGWRRLAAVALSRLPSLQALLLSLSRAVPGFADFVLRFHRHAALCATYPPSTVVDAADQTQT